MKDSIINILAMLRAQHWLYYSLHWQAADYQHHQLFQRLYESLSEQFDTLAEAIVTRFGREAVGAIATMKAAQDVVATWTGDSDIVQAMASEAGVILAIADALPDMKEDSGLDNLLRGFVDEHRNTNVYLLQQSGGTVAASVDAPDANAHAVAPAPAAAAPTESRPYLEQGALWAMLPTSLDKIMGAYRGTPTTAGVTLATRVSAASADKQAGGVAVVRIYGALSQKGCFWCDTLGMEGIGNLMDTLAADESITAILLDVDSPGGTYAGTPELAEKIRAAGAKKKVWAIANGMAASAAYWCASAASKFFCTPSGEVGSIGVVAVHYDYSKMLDNVGIKPTYVTYGQYKAEFNSDNPLTPEAAGELQKRVNEAGDGFVKAVATQRGKSQATVKADFGQGRMFSAQQAAKLGMIDGVDTLDGVLARLTGKKPANGGRKAAIERQRLALKKYE